MDKNRNISGLIIGVVLIIIGILALFGRYIVLPDMDTLWPLVVVAVGAAFFIPILLGDKTRGGLAVPGSILVTIGVILYIMNRTESWEAWSYCWALIMCAVGAGIWINGFTSNQPELQKRGLNVLRTGLILFIIFGVVMEFIFSISGEAHWGGLLLWAILLTLVGVYLLVTRLVRMRKPGGEQSDLFWPVLMIGLGLAAGISYIGGVSGFTFGRLFNLWPLLLIAAGVGLIFRNRTPWVGLILGILIVVGIFVVVFTGARLGLGSGGDWFPNIGPINFGNSNQTLTASGRQITQNRPVSGVRSVKLGTNVDLVIQQGAAESLSVTGDEAILPALLTDVSLGQMAIRYDPRYNIQSNTRPKLVLTVKDLNELRLSSSATVEVGPLNTGKFNIIVSSSCNLTIKGIQADTIAVRITSSADIAIQGEANSLDLDISSSVNFQAGDLKVQNADVTMSSSADVTLWVVNDLRANLSSSGNIAYYGSPAVHEINSSSGKLIPRGNK
jgi:Putative auto-transporter adhesin, head GIN domain